MLQTLIHFFSVLFGIQYNKLHNYNNNNSTVILYNEKTINKVRYFFTFIALYLYIYQYIYIFNIVEHETVSAFEAVKGRPVFCVKCRINIVISL